jgi:uncharacterized protein DUF1707
MCHHRHYHREHERSLEPFEGPAPPAPSGPVRVGDADRERVVELLRGHAAAGRLDADELGERLERTYAARYGDELQAVLAELPPEAAAPRRERSAPPGPRIAAFPLGIAALVAVAAVTGVWWLMWLIWPMAIVLGPRRHYRHRRHPV